MNFAGQFRDTEGMQTSSALYQRHRCLVEMISCTVWLYNCFTLSYRNIQKLLLYQVSRLLTKRFAPGDALLEPIQKIIVVLRQQNPLIAHGKHSKYGLARYRG
ncbi:MAG TPA: hypothetical protein V6D03_05785, partial [Candidatus Caenarcaniphilales bacterium]